MKMLNEQVTKRVHKLSNFLRAKAFLLLLHLGNIFFESCHLLVEDLVLLKVDFLVKLGLEEWEDNRLLSFMVVVDRLEDDLDEANKGSLVLRFDVGSVVVDSVKTADEAVVDEGHLDSGGADVIGEVPTTDRGGRKCDERKARFGLALNGVGRHVGQEWRDEVDKDGDEDVLTERPVRALLYSDLDMLYARPELP